MKRIPGVVVWLFLLSGLVSSAVSRAADSELAQAASQLLAAKCQECHGQNEREGGLRLLSKQDLVQRNDSGEPALVPGNAGQSELFRRVIAEPDERMPPEEEPLTAQEIELLKKWIDAGAQWPESSTGPVHWAYVVPQRPEVPPVKPQWQSHVQNSVDAFILEQLKQSGSGLEPSPPADPAKLLRRVTLDLIGLPPTPEQIEAFLADPSEDHLERIIDRLIASPQYGEKWARQWLDLARYADSNGFQADQFREIWAYRDWVVNAFNSDMPYDQFTIAQVAGDLLPEATIDDKVATGFHRCTTCNVEAGVDPEENRTNQIIDRVNTTGIVWLGTSLECAQCHNHKYDPFTMQDYYQIFAFFNNTPLEVVQPNGSGVQFEVSGPLVDLPLEEKQQDKLDSLRERQTQLTQQIQDRKQGLQKNRGAWEEKLAESLKTASQWHPLTPSAFQSSGGSSHKVLEDGSILLTGKAPDKDTYTVTFETELAGITGFKLEAMTDESLPGNGPGRGSDERPNFVLYEFDIEATAAEGVQVPVSLKNAAADFSQSNWPVAKLLDDDPATGWAINPQFGKPHWASFLTVEPLGDGNPLTLTVTLPQHYGGARTLGRFRILALTGDPGTDAIAPDLREILAIKPGKRTKAQNKKITEHYEQSDGELVELQKQQEGLKKQIDAIQPVTSLVMVEMDEPRMTSIFKRGNFLDPVAPVQPATPLSLHPLPEHSEGELPSRLDFAKWLVSPDNPLAARVAVNRWWSEFFGQGIVGTLEDFGSQGDAPTHPKLLDWLAVEFMESGWSMKHVHKLIVMSAAYQQNSSVGSDAREADPYNKLYARGPRLRLSAEEIRDNALAISGLLSLRMGGPPIYPPQPENIWRHVGRNAPKYQTDTDEDRFRRGLYVVYRRSAPYPSFVNFDAPDRGACVVKRSTTNTPLQALTLLNDPAYVEMAHAFAKRLRTDLPDSDDREKIEYAFRLATARLPRSEETTLLLGYLDSERKRLTADTETARQIAQLPSGEPKAAVEKAAWFELANIILNLDETITK